MTRALEREGPDNITVVLARFDGPGLAEPGPRDVVQFLPYDPGFDASDTRRPGRGESAEKVTVEVTVPKEVIRMTGGLHEDGGYRPRAPILPTGRGLSRAETRSLLTFVVLTLVAATAAGAFVRCDRMRALEREGHAAIEQIEGSAAPAADPPLPPPPQR